MLQTSTLAINFYPDTFRSGNTTITNRSQPRGTARKSCSTITRHQEDKLSKAISSLFPIKVIAILEWTKSNVQQNMNNYRLPQWELQITKSQQQQNHRLRTDSSLSHRGVGGGGLKCILLVPNLRPRFCCC